MKGQLYRRIETQLHHFPQMIILHYNYLTDVFTRDSFEADVVLK